MSQASAEVLVARGLVEIEGGYAWRADPRLRLDSRFRLSEEHVIAFCKAITCPVLLISAQEGWPFPAALMQARAQAIANLRHEHLAGKHHFHLDTPEPIAALVRPFFAAATS